MSNTAVTPDKAHRLVLSHIMTSDKVNFSGTIHGGHILLYLDQVAYACAARYSRHNVVTLSVDQVLFKQPIYVAELVTFFANVNFVGRTSMEVGIRVVAENLRARVERHVMTCYFTMVAVDEFMKPCSVPTLELTTEEEVQWFQKAEIRRAHRLTLVKKI